jgi:hypothetical protein
MDLLNCLRLCSLGVGIGKCSEILSVFFPVLLTHVCRLMDLITGSCNCSIYIKNSKVLTAPQNPPELICYSGWSLLSCGDDDSPDS